MKNKQSEDKETLEGFAKLLKDYEAQGMRPLGIGEAWAMYGVMEMMLNDLSKERERMEEAIEEVVDVVFTEHDMYIKSAMLQIGQSLDVTNRQMIVAKQQIKEDIKSKYLSNDKDDENTEGK